ncbi:MAG: RNA polymerase subunit sigma-70, partial [Oscillospiraceae bacterium]|nr:RNA polymerase subunit sigma-70 [Oscillospiraceae bacterium]
MLSAAVLVMSMFCALRLDTPGSFPKPLPRKEEQEYLERASRGDMEARNILIERNLRLVAHIMKKYYTQASDQE